jgi:CMP-N-acetylneuraminic acid synthetase
MSFDENSFAYKLPMWGVQDIDTFGDWERAEMLAKLISNN